MDPMLDMSIEGMDAQLAEREHVRPAPSADPWLRRRSNAWGASEMAMVLVATGRRSPTSIPQWQRDHLRLLGPSGMPRLYLEKAGVVGPLKAGHAAAMGNEREEELLDTWIHLLQQQEYAIEQEVDIDIATVRHASQVPREWMPLVCRRTRCIAATPDAWCRTTSGLLYDVEIKTTIGGINGCRWTWQVQVQAQGMATSSAGAIVVGGEHWARGSDTSGRVLRAFVEPDEALRAELAEAAEEAWEVVEKLRGSL
jgi:hypothetical protein